MTTDPRFPSTATRHGRRPTPLSVSERRRATTKPRRNILAVLGLLCGAAALVVAFVPNFGLLAWPLGGVGLALAVTGLVLAGKGKAADRGVAVGATAVSAAALLATGGLLVYDTFIGTGEAGLHMPAVTGDKHTVEFVVTAAGGANVRYGSLNDQRSETAPASTDPWQGEASYNTGSYLLTLTADTRNSNVNNQITCAILVDGNKVAENSGATIALCTANVG
jgi:hypothetical protein